MRLIVSFIFLKGNLLINMTLLECRSIEKDFNAAVYLIYSSKAGISLKNTRVITSY